MNIEETNEATRVPVDPIRIDDRRELVVTKWSPVVTADRPVSVTIEGVILVDGKMTVEEVDG